MGRAGTRGAAPPAGCGHAGPARSRRGVRVAHYSLQGDHAHLIAEAHGKHALACGMKSIGARLARALNRTSGRSGPVLDGRYHHRSLRSPREVDRPRTWLLSLGWRRHGLVDPREIPAGSG